MERNRDFIRQSIQLSTFGNILNCITDKLNLRPSDKSFADKLLNAIDKEGFISELKSLTREVIVYTKDSSFPEKRKHGEVYAYEVQIFSEKNTLVVTKQDPSEWEEFLQANQHNEVRIILVKSDSLPIVEAKLKVYKAFKSHIDSENIFLHHVFEEYDEIAKLSFHRKISWFRDNIKEYSKSISEANLKQIIEEAADKALTETNVRDLCFDANIKDNEVDVGTAHGRSYVCYSMFTVRKLKGNLVEETLQKIGESLGSEICREILRHIESRVKTKLKDDLIPLKFELTKELFASVTVIVMMAISVFFSSWLGVLVAVGTFLYTLVASVDVNSYEWRRNVAEEIHKKVTEKRSAILKKILPDIQKLCNNTSTDLETVADSLLALQQNIQLIDQDHAIKQWEQRIGMHVEDRTLLKNHPKFFKCLAGLNRNGEQVLKVYLRGKEPKPKPVEKRKPGEEPARDKEEETENSNLEKEISEIKSWFGDLENYHIEIVYVDTKSKEIKKKAQEIKLQEQNSPAIDKSTGMRLGGIIQKHCDKIHACYSNVIGIGISQVRCDGKTIIAGPCIVLYCLDKTIVPFGEKPLPEKLENIPCDLREDFVMFGMCPNPCPAFNRDLPEPGCSIGLPSKKYFGSVGFLVEPNKSNDQSNSGFLTASHVALENFEELYNKGFLSEQNPDYDNLSILHPFYRDGDDDNVVGRVVESYIGDYIYTTEDQNNAERKEGLDFAMVTTTTRTQELRPVPVFNDDHRIFVGNFNVVKSGNATGTTTGKLMHGFLSIKVDSLFSAPGYFVFSNCYAVKESDKGPFFSLGDSGSGVFVKDNDLLRPLGIAFAFLNSETAVCRVDKVIEKLGLEIVSCHENKNLPIDCPENRKSDPADTPECMECS